MHPYTRLALKVARNLYFRKRHLGVFVNSGVPLIDPSAGEKINAVLASGKPCMIARLGATETKSLSLFYITHKEQKSIFDYIQGRSPLMEDWARADHSELCKLSGFFPDGDLRLIEQFCELMLDCIPELDVLGSWLKFEELFDHMHKAPKVHLCNLEPYNTTPPWSRHLAGKKVLVVHPFATSIARQYKEKRTLLFKNPDVLPEFDLKVIPAVQSLNGAHPPEFNTWFDALDHMKAQIDACDYDVCLIGCGAYGFPLAAHVKRQGKQAIHLGGSLQLMFGIKGKRWTEQYGTVDNPYLDMFNEHWVFPDESERPASASKVENACYW